MNEKASSSRRFNILLVEDNEDDVLLTRYAFKKIRVPVEFQIARDGFDALAILRQSAPHGDTPLPHVILLDLNMPRMDGRQLLAELKRDARLQIIPAIILTTSAADDDVQNAYRNHAAAYMTKPIDLQDFARRTQTFADFWLSGVAVLPSHGK